MPSLEALLAAPDAQVTAVVTNPDRPAGRGMKLTPTPVKEAATGAGIPVLQPATARDESFALWLEAQRPDIAVVVAYGKILPAGLLQIPSGGFVNLHFSLLPAYRGAAPVQRAILDGRSITGISVMLLTEGMDEGPVLAELKVPIEPHDTAASLGQRLAVLGAPLLLETLRGWVAGEVEPREQDHARATYAPKITTGEARIDWGAPRARIDALVRGLYPEPGAWTTLQGARLKVFGAAAVDGPGLEPGGVTATAAGLFAGAGDGTLELTDVQLAGKRRMTGAELARGLRLPQQARLG